MSVIAYGNVDGQHKSMNIQFFSIYYSLCHHFKASWLIELLADVMAIGAQRK